jgi:hypothetical protein
MVQFSCPEPPQAGRPNSNKVFRLRQELPAPTTANSTGYDPGTPTLTYPGVINVNIHFMLRSNGIGNFNERDNGFAYKPWNANSPQDPTIPADTANNGYARALALVADMNSQAASNPLNSNPAGTANPDKGFSYALNGVYFHRVTPSEYDIVKDDVPGYYSPAAFDTCAVNKATEINMFMMGNYTNGACCDHGGLAFSKGYNSTAPDRHWLKTFNTYELYCWRQQNNGNTIPLPNGPYTIHSSR